MKKTLFWISVVLLVSTALAFANDAEKIEAGKNLVDSKASCSQLSDEQLESIGDYYMEQMHPGDAHELMDKMMGSDSESLKQMHINMAKRLYCNEDTGMMGCGMGSGMMSSGMMGSGMGMMSGTKKGTGMMGNNFSYGMGSYSWSLLNVLYLILLIGLIILVYSWIIKLWKNFNKKSRK